MEIEMKIEQVQITRSATVFPCLKCGKAINGAVERVWADLDGEPYKAYYHTVCRPDLPKVEENDGD